MRNCFRPLLCLFPIIGAGVLLPACFSFIRLWSKPVFLLVGIFSTACSHGEEASSVQSILRTFGFVQGMIQAFLWTGDNVTSSEVSSILANGNVSTAFLPWLNIKNGDYNLKMCSMAPYGVKDVDQVCTTVFDSGTNYSQSPWMDPPGFQRSVEDVPMPVTNLDSPSLAVSSVALPRDSSSGSSPLSVTVMLADTGQTSTLSAQCTRVLLYPAHRFRDSMNEELSLIFSQFWLLSISSSAILSQSISHILAVFFMRVLTTAWSAYTIWRTADLKIRLDRLVVNPDTPCHTDLFPGYFHTRLAFQIPDLILNVFALLFTAILGWRLVKTFNQNTFNCVGPPANIVRLYRYLLAVVVTEQLMLYSLLTGMGLALKEGLITKAKLIGLDIVLFVASLILVPIMLILGYRATRYEKKRLMIVFFVLLACFTGGFGMMFTISAFRFMWLQWPFFACVTGISVAQLLCCTAFAILCRIHFGQGLSHYLHVESVLADYDFEPDEFSTKDTSTAREPNRLSAVIANGNIPVLTRDTAWDFTDLDRNRTRPPVYTVELTDDNFKK